MRFRHLTSTPPGGVYFYEVDGHYVEARTSADICLLVKDLHASLGRPVPFDPMSLVMAHMCPSMPPGFCDGPGGVETSLMRVGEVKARTAELFGRTPAPPVVVRERLHACLSCSENERASCPSCSGLLDWVLKGVGNRTRIPADDFAFVCRPSRVFVSALASVDDPGPPPEGAPDSCWRKRK